VREQAGRYISPASLCHKGTGVAGVEGMGQGVCVQAGGPTGGVGGGAGSGAARACLQVGVGRHAGPAAAPPSLPGEGQRGMSNAVHTRMVPAPECCMHVMPHMVGLSCQNNT